MEFIKSLIPIITKARSVIRVLIMVKDDLAWMHDMSVAAKKILANEKVDDEELDQVTAMLNDLIERSGRLHAEVKKLGLPKSK